MSKEKLVTQGHIRIMAKRDLMQVLEWRNHIDIRRYMYTQHEIELDEHLHWYKKASRDSNRHLLIYEENNVPLGFSSLSQLNSSPVAHWGFYVSPSAPKGTGYQLGNTTLEYAFNKLTLHKIFTQVISYNKSSIRLHHRLGFNEEGVLHEQYFDGKNYHSVFCFGLLVQAWKPRLQEKTNV